MASDNSMCPGSTQLLKNEYQDTSEGKDSRCVRLTTYHQVLMSQNVEALTSQNPLGRPHRPVMGKLYLFQVMPNLPNILLYHLANLKVCNNPYLLSFTNFETGRRGTVTKCKGRVK
jgi:hypothetical protein